MGGWVGGWEYLGGWVGLRVLACRRACVQARWHVCGHTCRRADVHVCVAKQAVPACRGATACTTVMLSGYCHGTAGLLLPVQPCRRAAPPPPGRLHCRSGAPSCCPAAPLYRHVLHGFVMPLYPAAIPPCHCTAMCLPVPPVVLPRLGSRAARPPAGSGRRVDIPMRCRRPRAYM